MILKIQFNSVIRFELRLKGKNFDCCYCQWVACRQDGTRIKYSDVDGDRKWIVIKRKEKKRNWERNSNLTFWDIIKKMNRVWWNNEVMSAHAQLKYALLEQKECRDGHSTFWNERPPSFTNPSSEDWHIGEGAEAKTNIYTRTLC